MDYKIIKIKKIETPGEGFLSFFEALRDFPFPIMRIYYIYGVESGIKRGGHAHKRLKQILFCPFGKIEIILDDGVSRESVLLDEPNKAIIIEKPLWREMLWIEKNSVLCVGASDYYSEDDYIRHYDDFISFLERK